MIMSLEGVVTQRYCKLSFIHQTYNITNNTQRDTVTRLHTHTKRTQMSVIHITLG
jgi:hypothetical protein